MEEEGAQAKQDATDVRLGTGTIGRKSHRLLAEYVRVEKLHLRTEIDAAVEPQLKGSCFARAEGFAQKASSWNQNQFRAALAEHLGGGRGFREKSRRIQATKQGIPLGEAGPA